MANEFGEPWKCEYPYVEISDHLSNAIVMYDDDDEPVPTLPDSKQMQRIVVLTQQASREQPTIESRKRNVLVDASGHRHLASTDGHQPSTPAGNRASETTTTCNVQVARSTEYQPADSARQSEAMPNH